MKTLTTALVCATALAAVPAAAEYPERPIEIIVPAPAGGGTDTSARKLAELLEAELGTSIAILNVAGGGGSVGVTQASQTAIPCSPPGTARSPPSRRSSRSPTASTTSSRSRARPRPPTSCA